MPLMCQNGNNLGLKWQHLRIGDIKTAHLRSFSGVLLFNGLNC